MLHEFGVHVNLEKLKNHARMQDDHDHQIETFHLVRKGGDHRSLQEVLYITSIFIVLVFDIGSSVFL